MKYFNFFYGRHTALTPAAKKRISSEKHVSLKNLRPKSFASSIQSAWNCMEFMKILGIRLLSEKSTRIFGSKEYTKENENNIRDLIDCVHATLMNSGNYFSYLDISLIYTVTVVYFRQLNH